MIDLKKYSNKKIIIGIYVLTFIVLLLLGVNGNKIGEIVGAYVQVSILNILFMMIPAFPLAIYNKVKNKTFFISKGMIKISFIIGLSLTILFVLFSNETIFNFGHILAPICLVINFFRENPKEVPRK